MKVAQKEQIPPRIGIVVDVAGTPVAVFNVENGECLTSPGQRVPIMSSNRVRGVSGPGACDNMTGRLS